MIQSKTCGKSGLNCSSRNLLSLPDLERNEAPDFSDCAAVFAVIIRELGTEKKHWTAPYGNAFQWRAPEKTDAPERYPAFAISSKGRAGNLKIKKIFC